MQLRQFEWTVRSPHILQQIEVKLRSISSYLIFREQSL